MTVAPDMPANWSEHDREPHPTYRQRAFDTFDYLDRMRPEEVGAHIDPFEKASPFLRFDEAGLEVFKDWRRKLEARLRADELHPALESHLAKYRKLVPSLALIHHLASGMTGPVGDLAVLAALSWAEFLESHAHRIFQAGTATAVDGAKAIQRGLKRGSLEARFTVNDVAHKNWSPMGEDRTRIREALDLLEEYGWLRAIDIPASAKGGRPTVHFIANPKGMGQ
jgi:hypothetical protein